MWLLMVISISLLLLTQIIEMSTSGDVERFPEREKRAIDLNVIVRNILLKSAAVSNFRSTLISPTQQPTRTRPTTPLPNTTVPFSFPLKFSLFQGGAFIPTTSQFYSAPITSTRRPPATSAPSLNLTFLSQALQNLALMSAPQRPQQNSMVFQMSSAPSSSVQQTENTSEVSQTSSADVSGTQVNQEQNAQSQQSGASSNLQPPPSSPQVSSSFTDATGSQNQLSASPMRQSAPSVSPPAQVPLPQFALPQSIGSQSFAPQSPSPQSLILQSLPLQFLSQSPQSQAQQFLGPQSQPQQESQSQPQLSQSSPRQSLSSQSLQPQSSEPQSSPVQSLEPESQLRQSVQTESVQSQSVQPQSVQPQSVQLQSSLPQSSLPQPSSPQSTPPQSLLSQETLVNGFPQFRVVSDVDDSSTINNIQGNRNIVDLPASVGSNLEEANVAAPNLLQTDLATNQRVTSFNGALGPSRVTSPGDYIDSSGTIQSIPQFNMLERQQLSPYSNYLDYAFSALDPEINYQYRFP